MKAIVLGASGLVGSHVFAEGIRRNIAVIGTARAHSPPLEQLDVTDRPAVLAMVRDTTPDVVILAAAVANVDRCEEEPGPTARVNVDATRTVAEVCAEIGARMVFYSTDYVFDGRAGPYGEDDPPSPIGEYGRQKVEAEAEIRGLLPTTHLILRTTVVYGTESAGKNFVIRLLRNLESQTPIRVPTDQVGSPILADDLAAATWDLVAIGATGTFNTAGSERMSRFAFAQLVAKTFGLDPSPIVPVATPELNQQARRPLEAGLRVDKIERTLGRPMPGASQGLIHFRSGFSR